MKVVLVEDNPADARLTQEILNETECIVSLLIVTDGEEAIRTIDEMCAECKPPHLILLDLKLPKKGGLEVLKHIRESDRCGMAKVAILTGSLLPEDKMRARELRADAFIIKPMSSKEFQQVAAELKSLITICSAN